MLSLLSLFVLAFSPTAQAQGGYPGGGGSGGYPGGGNTGTGHYDVSYGITAGSGNTATYTTSGYPGSGASVSATDSKSCVTNSGGSPTSYHIAATKTLTATFTWNNEGNPANLSPACAVVIQSSSVSWSAQAQGVTPTGDCDTGLPNPVYTPGYLSKSGTSDNGDYTGQHLFFYDVTTDDKVTVACYPNVQFPDGNVQNLSLTSQYVTFKKPSTTWLVKEGYIQPFTLPQYSGYQLYGLAADPATASQHPNGEDWNPIDITMPSGFPSAGQCCFTQLVTPNHTQTKSGIVTPVKVGPQGLDGTFEYLDYTWSLPGQGAAGDNPSIPTNAASNATFSSGDQQAASDNFTTYVMFRPAAVGSQGTIWAPLQSYTWSARTTITYDGSQWNILPAQSYPASPSAPAIKGADTSDPPQWTCAY